MTLTARIRYPLSFDEAIWANRASCPRAVKVSLRLERKTGKRGIKLIAMLSPSGFDHHVTLMFATRVLRVYSEGAIVQQISPCFYRHDPHWEAHRERFHAMAINNAGADRRRGWLKAARINITMAREDRTRGESL